MYQPEPEYWAYENERVLRSLPMERPFANAGLSHSKNELDMHSYNPEPRGKRFAGCKCPKKKEYISKGKYGHVSVSDTLFLVGHKNPARTLIREMEELLIHLNEYVIDGSVGNASETAASIVELGAQSINPENIVEGEARCEKLEIFT